MVHVPNATSLRMEWTWAIPIKEQARSWKLLITRFLTTSVVCRRAVFTRSEAFLGIGVTRW